MNTWSLFIQILKYTHSEIYLILKYHQIFIKIAFLILSFLTDNPTSTAED